jgi:hypothetical protein
MFLQISGKSSLRLACRDRANEGVDFGTDGIGVVKTSLHPFRNLRRADVRANQRTDRGPSMAVLPSHVGIGKDGLLEFFGIPAGARDYAGTR